MRWAWLLVLCVGCAQEIPAYHYGDSVLIGTFGTPEGMKSNLYVVTIEEHHHYGYQEGLSGWMYIGPELPPESWKAISQLKITQKHYGETVLIGTFGPPDGSKSNLYVITIEERHYYGYQQGTSGYLHLGPEVPADVWKVIRDRIQQEVNNGPKTS
jgi:hypothetical protein